MVLTKLMSHEYSVTFRLISVSLNYRQVITLLRLFNLFLEEGSAGGGVGVEVLICTSYISFQCNMKTNFYKIFK